MALWIVVAALVAVGAGVAVALLLARRRGSPALADPSAAARTAEQALPGFAALEALIGNDRRAALVVGRANRVALVTARGRRVAAREVRWSDVRALSGGMTVGASRPVFVAGVDVLDVRRAGGAEMRREDR